MKFNIPFHPCVWNYRESNQETISLCGPTTERKWSSLTNGTTVSVLLQTELGEIRREIFASHFCFGKIPSVPDFNSQMWTVASKELTATYRWIKTNRRNKGTATTLTQDLLLLASVNACRKSKCGWCETCSPKLQRPVFKMNRAVLSQSYFEEDWQLQNLLKVVLLYYTRNFRLILFLICFEMDFSNHWIKNCKVNFENRQRHRNKQKNSWSYVYRQKRNALFSFLIHQTK